MTKSKLLDNSTFNNQFNNTADYSFTAVQTKNAVIGRPFKRHVNHSSTLCTDSLHSTDLNCKTASVLEPSTSAPFSTESKINSPIFDLSLGKRGGVDVDEEDSQSEESQSGNDLEHLAGIEEEA